MSKMIIYAALTAIGGNVENVWGHQMRVKTIDPSNKDEVEQAKADGWEKSPQAVIDAIEAKTLEAENKSMQGKLDNLDAKERITELEAENEKLESQLSEALTEVAELTERLAVYETVADTDGDGQIDYEKLENKDLKELLGVRGVKYKARDDKAALIQLAKDSE